MVSAWSPSPSNAPEEPVRENVRLEKRRCVLGGRRLDDPREERKTVSHQKISKVVLLYFTLTRRTEPVFRFQPAPKLYRHLRPTPSSSHVHPNSNPTQPPPHILNSIPSLPLSLQHLKKLGLEELLRPSLDRRREGVEGAKREEVELVWVCLVPLFFKVKLKSQFSVCKQKGNI
jgi:hypothetical protein